MLQTWTIVTGSCLQGNYLANLCLPVCQAVASHADGAVASRHAGEPVARRANEGG